MVHNEHATFGTIDLGTGDTAMIGVWSPGPDEQLPPLVAVDIPQGVMTPDAADQGAVYAMLSARQRGARDCEPPENRP